jgi:hypothetical protein
MKKINLNDTVYTIVKRYPTITDCFIESGFDQIVKHGMIESVGRFMTLKAGIKFKKLNRDKVETIFQSYGYSLEDNNE